MPEAVVWGEEVTIAQWTGLDQIHSALTHGQAAKDAKKEAPKEAKEENAEKKDAAPSEPMSPANQAQSCCAE